MLKYPDFMQDTLKAIHSTFCKLTSQPDLKYQPCERQLYEFHTAGFTEADLTSVLTFMLWCNRKREPRYRDRILFHRIVGDLETFNSRLGEAKAWDRNRKKPETPRQKILESSGRPAVVEGKTRSVKELFQQMGGVA